MTRLSLLAWLLMPSCLCAQQPADVHAFVTRCLDEGNAAAAERYLDTVAHQARQRKDLTRWAWAGWERHRLYSERPEKALQILDNTLQNAWTAPNDSVANEPFLWLHCNKGWLLYRMGRVYEANRSLEKAAALFERYRYSEFEPVEFLYKLLGANYTRLGDNDKAALVLQKAIALAGESGGLLANLGIAHWNNGDHAAAEACYRKGLALQTVSRAEKALLLGRLAETLLEQGRTKEALRTAQSALTYLSPKPEDSREHAYRARALRVSALANMQTGNYRAAQRLLSESLAYERKAPAPSQRELAKGLTLQGRARLHFDDPEGALQLADQALAAVIPKYAASGLFSPNPSPALLYAENAIGEALMLKMEAAGRCYAKNGDLRWLEYALECHDLAWQAEMKLRSVFQYNSSKLRLQQESRERAEAAMGIARALYEKTGNAVWAERAFALAERSKALLLLEAAQENIFRQNLRAIDLRLPKLESLRQGLQYFEKNILLEPNNQKVGQWRLEADSLRGNIAALEAELRAAYPALAQLEGSNAQWVPTSGELSPGEALLAYFWGKEWVEVFVFRPRSQPVWERISLHDGFEATVRQYLGFFSQDFAILNEPAVFLETAHRLSSALLPAAAKSAKALWVIPDGLLHFLPFEALVTEVPAGKSVRDAAYLLRSHELRYAWSWAVLRHQRKIASKAKRYLLALSPLFSNGQKGLAPIEKPDIGWSWGNKHLVGLDASAVRFKQLGGQYRNLLFSTHAFAGDNPRIELADSALLLPDLYATALQADLVTLSACQTSLGKEAKGEGVMSLARAFAQAGAACVVSSLWSVNDRSTALLVRQFYRHLESGQPTAAALRQAKLDYLADPLVGNAAQSPYFWAGMVAVGDNRAVERPMMPWALLWLMGILLAAFLYLAASKVRMYRK
jgi:CHAT domain-containing protein